MDNILPVTVAIPTYRRERVLVETLEFLLALRPRAAEILVLDQSESHDAATDRSLSALHAGGDIRWMRLPTPSIPCAMNEGLRQATHDLVLFFDDDIRPEPDLLVRHVDAHALHPDGLVAGRVIQPWQEGVEYGREGPFHFASKERALINEFIGCNFSVSKAVAIRLGGFDENFVKVAYRFEAEFAHRFRAGGRSIFFEPAACLHHLKAGAGGTRSYGEHLTTWRPDHAVGAYYFALRAGVAREFVKRPFAAIATRYHLRHPWRIPATLMAELAGMCWAAVLFARGPRYVVAVHRKSVP